jgi:hypothetical protein
MGLNGRHTTTHPQLGLVDSFMPSAPTNAFLQTLDTVGATGHHHPNVDVKLHPPSLPVSISGCLRGANLLSSPWYCGIT